MTSSHQVLIQGNLIGLVFLRDDTPGSNGLTAGVLPLGRAGRWPETDSVNFKGNGLRVITLPRDTPEQEAINAALVDAGIDWKQCQTCPNT